jgi:hypothetical protein
MLSLLYKEEFTLGFNRLPDPLGRALAAAQRAVEGAPSNHLACHARQRPSSSFAGSWMPSKSRRRGLLLLIRWMDSRLRTGGPNCSCRRSGTRRGAPTAEARSLNPHHPGWYWFVPCLDAYCRGEFKTSLEFAHKVNMPGFWRSPTLHRRELRATRSKGCTERCPLDSSDSEARHCQTSLPGVSDLAATGYGRTSDRRPLRSWP